MVADAEKPKATDTPVTAVSILLRLLKESAEYGRYYLQAQLAKAQLVLAKVLLLVAVGLAAGLAGLACIVTAGVLLVRGIAEALTALFGGHAWIGDIVTGLLLLGGIVAGAYFGTLLATRGLRAGYKEMLEGMRRQQRETLGTDVRERADATWETHVPH